MAKEEYLNESIEIATDYFSKAGLNEEGLDIVIEEVGVEDFTEFVTELGVELNEERAARKMNVRTKGSIKKQIEKDAAAEAKRKEKKTGEYKEAPKKKAKVGGPSYATKVKPEAKKPEQKPVAKKVEKAVEKAKTKQPPKPISKGGLRDRISSAVKKGVERHKAAVKKVSSSPAAKGAKEFGKGVVSGVKDTVTFAKKAKKAVVGEEVLTEVKVSRLNPSDSKEDKKKKIQQMLDRQREWEKKKGRIPAGHATEEVVHEGKCDDCTCEGCGPDGVGHQNPCVECGEHHKDIKEALSDRAKKEVERDARNADNPLHKPGRRTLKQLTYARELALKNQKKKVTKEEVVDEAKVDTGSAEEKATARNKRNTPPGANRKFDTSVFITRKPGESLDSARTRKRRDAHAAKRGVKEEVKDKQGLDKYDRHKRMIRHKQDKYGRNVIGADYNLENERKAKGWKKKLNKEDRAFDNVVASLRKKHGKDAVITKDSPKPKPQPKAKPKPQKPLSDKEKAQREVDAQYGRTPWNKKGSLGT